MNSFESTYIDILESIDDCVKQRRIIPGLILLYSAIDSFSNLSEKTSHKGRKIFKAWVKKWMLEKYPLPCNETDIYAARCGLIHQHISESDLSSKQVAREIYYAWGSGNADILQKSIDTSDKIGKAIAVKLEDLIWSFRKGMADCYNSINDHKNWKLSFERKAKKYFVSVNHPV